MSHLDSLAKDESRNASREGRVFLYAKLVQPID